MPPRKTNTASSSSTTSSTPRRQTRQSTLSFGRPARVTKSTATSTPPIVAKEALKKAVSSESKPSTHTISTSNTDSTTKPDVPKESHLPTPAPSSPTTAVQPTPDEAAARKISKKSLERYHGTAILHNRLLPPIHQDDLSLEEKILRHFDMSSQYGPFTGVTRVERWVRAKRLGLDPPIEVLAVALMMEDKKGGGDMGRDCRKAYVDEWFSTTARATA